MEQTNEEVKAAQKAYREAFKEKFGTDVLVIGGMGTGKMFKYIKPNLLQDNCAMVVTDSELCPLVPIGHEDLMSKKMMFMMYTDKFTNDPEMSREVKNQLWDAIAEVAFNKRKAYDCTIKRTAGLYEILRELGEKPQLLAGKCYVGEKAFEHLWIVLNGKTIDLQRYSEAVNANNCKGDFFAAYQGYDAHYMEETEVTDAKPYLGDAEIRIIESKEEQG